MVARHIPAFKLVPHPLSEEAEVLLHRPAYVDASIGDRHRLGGSPDRWNEAAAPRCSSCGDDMTFYAQLDALPSGGFALARFGLDLRVRLLRLLRGVSGTRQRMTAAPR